MKYACLTLLALTIIIISTAQQQQDTVNLITQLPAAFKDATLISHSLSAQEQTTNKAGELVIPVIETIGTVITTVFYTIIGATTMSGVATEAIWADHPNLAKALQNPDVFENFIVKARGENPAYAQEFEAMIAEAEQ